MTIRTPDGRYIVVRGRLWRAANPRLTDAERKALTRELMSARRAIAAAQKKQDDAAIRRARRRVHRSKVALGERGAVWWRDGAPDLNRRLIQNSPYQPWWSRLQRLQAAILDLLEERGPSKSICPSDVARREGSKWRSSLEDVRTAARSLAAAGQIRVTQKDRQLDPADEWRGPVRFRLVPYDD